MIQSEHLKGTCSTSLYQCTVNGRARRPRKSKGDKSSRELGLPPCAVTGSHLLSRRREHTVTLKRTMCFHALFALNEDLMTHGKADKKSKSQKLVRGASM
ncbi:hypothetical protein BaRGS_00002864 [Batillaria attramentaria]|uniref:Uncharacterized protein n=1 Tax=Batillaria attramentaria TaxID=370345 RepID=A0ABD0M4G9_9CAEN